MGAKEDAVRLVSPGNTVYLVTVGADGQPDARAMMPVECEGLKTVWMVTGKSCDKSRQLAQNPNCLLYATDPDDTENYLELRLWGSMELLDDAASRARAWREEYLQYFPGGKDDPEVCVLKFTAASAALQTMAGKEKFTV